MNNDFPTFDEVLDKLRELAEIEVLDPDAPVTSLEVDSLDIIEWVFTLEEQGGFTVDESMFDGLEDLTLREVYDRLRELVTAAV